VLSVFILSYLKESVQSLFLSQHLVLHGFSAIRLRIGYPRTKSDFCLCACSLRQATAHSVATKINMLIFKELRYLPAGVLIYSLGQLPLKSREASSDGSASRLGAKAGSDASHSTVSLGTLRSHMLLQTRADMLRPVCQSFHQLVN